MLDDVRALFENTSNSTKNEFKNLAVNDSKFRDAVIYSRDKLRFCLQTAES